MQTLEDAADARFPMLNSSTGWWEHEVGLVQNKTHTAPLLVKQQGVVLLKAAVWFSRCGIKGAENDLKVLLHHHVCIILWKTTVNTEHEHTSFSHLKVNSNCTWTDVKWVKWGYLDLCVESQNKTGRQSDFYRNSKENSNYVMAYNRTCCVSSGYFWAFFSVWPIVAER